MSKQQIIDPYKPSFTRLSLKQLREFYKNLFLKYRDLQANIRVLVDERAHALLQKKAYEEYQDTAREIVYYLRAHPDFRTLSTPAKMGIQFLIKTQDIWHRNLEVRRNYEGIYRLLWIDLLPPADREEIKNFLEGKTARHWKYQNWEIEIMKDFSLSHVEVAYKIGRSIAAVWWYRYKQLGWRKHKGQENLQKRAKTEKARI